MSDALVREAQRRFLASGTHEDGVAWLQARWRTDRAGVELLAELGHPAARAVCPDGRWLDPDKWVMTLSRWVDRLAARGQQARVRTHIAIARLIWAREGGPLPVPGGKELLRRRLGWTPEHDGAAASDDERTVLHALALRALDAAERWAADPTAARAKVAWSAGVEALTTVARRARRVRALAEVGRDSLDHADALDGLGGAMSPAIAAALAAGDGPGRAAIPDDVAERAPDWSAPNWSAARAFIAGDAVIPIRDAVRAELLPWALGADDPVKARCAATEAPAPCPGLRDDSPVDDTVDVEALPRHRLVLAAWLGDPGSERALEWAAPREKDGLRGLAARDPEAMTRLALARVRASLELDAYQGSPMVALSAAERQLIAPGDSEADALAAVARMAGPAREALARSQRGLERGARGSSPMQWLLACAAVALAFERPLRVLLGVDTKGRAPGRLLAEAAAFIDRHAPAIDGARDGRHAEANAALPIIREELVPWLLGRGDPLRDRHLPAERPAKKKAAKKKAPRRGETAAKTKAARTKAAKTKRR